MLLPVDGTLFPYPALVGIWGTADRADPRLAAPSCFRLSRMWSWDVSRGVALAAAFVPLTSRSVRPFVCLMCALACLRL